MTIWFATIAVFFHFATTTYFWRSPQTRFELGMGELEPPPCRELNSVEKAKYGFQPEGKGSNFYLRGAYLCERKIFSSRERPKFIDFVTEHAPIIAKEKVTLMVEKMRMQLKPVAIEVIADDPQLKNYLQRLFQVELVKQLGGGKVVRHANQIIEHRPLWKIKLLEVSDEKVLLADEIIL